MRKLALLSAVPASILAAGASFAQIPAEHVQAGTLTLLLDRRRPKNLSSFGAKNPRLPVKPEMQFTGKG